MKIYKFSEARLNLSAVLECAKKEGSVRIHRRDGCVFTITPVTESQSPLAVEGGVDLRLQRSELVAAVREGREPALGGDRLCEA